MATVSKRTSCKQSLQPELSTMSRRCVSLQHIHLAVLSNEIRSLIIASIPCYNTVVICCMKFIHSTSTD